MDWILSACIGVICGLVFRAFTFDGKRTASKALATVEEQGSYLWIDDVAVISVGKLGMAKVESTWAQSDSTVGASGGLGALTGALVGCLFGPGGTLAGAIGGGSIGTMVGAGVNGAISDPRLEEFADKMKKDTSATDSRRRRSLRRRIFDSLRSLRRRLDRNRTRRRRRSADS